MIYHVDFIGYADRGSAVLVDASFSFNNRQLSDATVRLK
ncbi:unnamed protein product [Fusarium graminearum]|nr:hypothetical protein FG05_35368 [Fusarium graminearum]CZS82716.1 unnamed protein product [Fusarium graminearum]